MSEKEDRQQKLKDQAEARKRKGEDKFIPFSTMKRLSNAVKKGKLRLRS